jgi:hypothetical protein
MCRLGHQLCTEILAFESKFWNSSRFQLDLIYFIARTLHFLVDLKIGILRVGGTPVASPSLMKMERTGPLKSGASIS